MCLPLFYVGLSMSIIILKIFEFVSDFSLLTVASEPCKKKKRTMQKDQHTREKVANEAEVDYYDISIKQNNTDQELGMRPICRHNFGHNRYLC